MDVSGFAALQEYLAARHTASPEYGPPDILDPATRARLLEVHADANRRLFAACMPDLPEDSYADDAATFALGNVLTAPARCRPPAGSVVAGLAATPLNRASAALLGSAAEVGRRLPAERRQRLLNLRDCFVRLG